MFAGIFVAILQCVTWLASSRLRCCATLVKTSPADGTLAQIFFLSATASNVAIRNVCVSAVQKAELRLPDAYQARVAVATATVFHALQAAPWSGAVAQWRRTR